MRHFFVAILVFLLLKCSHQNLRSEAKSQSPYFDTLEDKEYGLTFYLDTLRINVYAYTKNGTLLWKTDPWKDNNLEEYRYKRPIINYFNFSNNRFTDSTEVIAIGYNSTQFGYLDKRTGRFKFAGND